MLQQQQGRSRMQAIQSRLTYKVTVSFTCSQRRTAELRHVFRYLWTYGGAGLLSWLLEVQVKIVFITQSINTCI